MAEAGKRGGERAEVWEAVGGASFGGPGWRTPPLKRTEAFSDRLRQGAPPPPTSKNPRHRFVLAVGLLPSTAWPLAPLSSICTTGPRWSATHLLSSRASGGSLTSAIRARSGAGASACGTSSRKPLTTPSRLPMAMTWRRSASFSPEHLRQHPEQCCRRAWHPPGVTVPRALVADHSPRLGAAEAAPPDSRVVISAPSVFALEYSG